MSQSFLILLLLLFLLCIFCTFLVVSFKACRGSLSHHKKLPKEHKRHLNHVNQSQYVSEASLLSELVTIHSAVLHGVGELKGELEGCLCYQHQSQAEVDQSRHSSKLAQVVIKLLNWVVLIVQAILVVRLMPLVLVVEQIRLVEDIHGEEEHVE